MGSDRVIVSDRVIGSDCVFGSDRVLGSDRVFGSDRYPQKLVDYLKQQSVSYVVVGHTPHGNAPTAIPHDGVTCIMVPCLPCCLPVPLVSTLPQSEWCASRVRLAQTQIVHDSVHRVIQASVK